MTEILQDLASTKLVRVTGSYADGSQTEESDIDFYVRPDHPERQGQNIKRIIAVLAKHGVKWSSNLPGYVFTHRTSGNGGLAVQMEFGDVYKPRQKKLKSVEIEGVMFATY